MPLQGESRLPEVVGDKDRQRRVRFPDDSEFKRYGMFSHDVTVVGRHSATRPDMPPRELSGRVTVPRTIAS